MRAALATVLGALTLVALPAPSARADDPPPAEDRPRPAEERPPATWGVDPPIPSAPPAAPPPSPAPDSTPEEGPQGPPPVGPQDDAPFPFNVSQSTPPLGLLPDKEDRLIDPRMARGWGEGRSRWFLATTIDVGFVYGRPRASLGYGKPFTSWFGIDVNPIANNNGLGAYGGARLELPFFDVRGGVRYFSAFNRTFLDQRPEYDRLALETESNRGAAKVLTYEVEADISLPLGPGNILGRASLSYVDNVPDGFNVFEETLRVIVEPPLVWRGRAGYALRFGKYQQHSIAVVADLLHVPARDDARTLRVGPIIRFVLSRRVEVRGSFVPTAYSIDKIGLRGGDFTELGVRYRWASD
jgi:hypothetical protein